MCCWRRATAGLSADDRAELHAWGSLAWPACLSGLLFTLMGFTAEVLLGHFQHGDHLPAASSAELVIDLTAALLLRGPFVAINTLSANAYGAGRTELAGRRLQLGLAAAAILSICVAPVWCFAGDILHAVSHSSSLDVGHVNTFGRWRAVGILPVAVFQALSSWLQGRKVTRPALHAALLGFCVNLVLNVTLIFGCFGWSGLGFIGSPIATASSRWVMVLTLLFSCRHEVAVCWPSDCMPAFTARRVGEFMKMALPLTLSALLEEMNVELVGIFALQFGPQDLATHNCMLTAFLLLSTVMDGSAVGIRTRVAHYIVVGDVLRLRRMVRLVARIMVMWSLVVSVAFVVLQDRIGMIFSANEEVWRISGQLAFLVGPVYFLMTIFYIAVSVLEGLSRANAIMVAFILGCYFVGLPLTYLFGFKVPASAFEWWPYFDRPSGASGCGVLGLWAGLCIGYTVMMCVAAGRLVCLKDWDREVARAREIAELSGGANGDAATPSAAGSVAGGDDGECPSSSRPPAAAGASAASAGAERGQAPLVGAEAPSAAANLSGGDAC